MNLHQQMLHKTRLAKHHLLDAVENVQSFLATQQHAQGAFIDRAGDADLYYTVFGIDCYLALSDQPLAVIKQYIESINDFSELDLIHLCCLMRCAMTLNCHAFIAAHKQEWIQLLESYASADGAYNQNKQEAYGSAYACFIVMDAYQCLEEAIPRTEAMLACINAVYCGDGGYALLPQEKMGTTPTTCAALLALQQLGQDIPDDSQTWLRSRSSAAGGFQAGPLTPIPDLLSTATALHALSLYGDDCADINERCLDFIDSLWSSKGSFFAYWDDEHLDVEYTFYGLLALGHLSSAPSHA